MKAVIFEIASQVAVHTIHKATERKVKAWLKDRGFSLETHDYYFHS